MGGDRHGQGEVLLAPLLHLGHEDVHLAVTSGLGTEGPVPTSEGLGDVAEEERFGVGASAPVHDRETRTVLQCGDVVDDGDVVGSDPDRGVLERPEHAAVAEGGRPLVVGTHHTGRFAVEQAVEQIDPGLGETTHRLDRRGRRDPLREAGRDDDGHQGRHSDEQPDPPGHATNRTPSRARDHNAGASRAPVEVDRVRRVRSAT